MQLTLIPTRPLRTRVTSAEYLVVVIVISLLLIPGPGLAQTHRGPSAPERIRFTTGAISAQVHGQFSRLNERPRYVVKARKGDHMVVNIIPLTRGLSMSGTVASPSGQGDGGPGGIIMNADLTENGDYIIEVGQHTMGSNFNSGSFILEIVITPAWLKN